MFSTVHELQARRAVTPVRRRLVVRWLAWALCTVFFFASLTASLAQDSVSKEYQIKAAYLYNFAKFVEWPADCFTNSESPLVIGVFGQNPFGDELEAIAKDHKINGRDIVIKPVATMAEAGGVHLMFFGATEDDHVAGALAALKKSRGLTVGESEKFIAAGGMINFVRAADKVRFEINASAAAQAGLKISAQLLKLAMAIHKESK
ncbi:MAG: YfiR family protein [Verrucomicrobiota bacterium]|jgi:hypothetical protein